MSRIRMCRSASALPRLDDSSPHYEGAVLLSWQCTPGGGGRCQPKSSQHRGARSLSKPPVVPIDELNRPFSPYVIDEHVEVSEKDLHRCGNDLHLLRQCAKKGRTCLEPRPTPSGSASPELFKTSTAEDICGDLASQLEKLRRSTEERHQGGPLPRVLGRWSMMQLMEEKSSLHGRQREVQKPNAKRQLGVPGRLAVSPAKDAGSTASGMSSARSTATGGSSNAPSQGSMPSRGVEQRVLHVLD